MSADSISAAAPSGAQPLPSRRTRLDKLPAPPAEEPPQMIIDRFRAFMGETIKGYNFTAELKKRMDFQNPYILEEVVRQFHIDETDSRFPPEMFNPKGFQEEDFIEAITATQLRAEEERVAAQASRVNVPFVSGGMQQPYLPSTISGGLQQQQQQQQQQLLGGIGRGVLISGHGLPHSASLTAAPSASSALPSHGMSVSAAVAAAAAAANAIAANAKRPSVSIASAAAIPAGTSGEPAAKRKSKWDAAS